MCTLPRKTAFAIVPPMIAAAMLSRKLDSTNTIQSSTKPPFQSSGRMRGSSSGTWLSSKCFESSAKPSSRQQQVGEDHPLVRHVPAEALEARRRAVKPVKANL